MFTLGNSLKRHQTLVPLLNEWNNGIAGNTALVPGVTLDPDVTALTPSLAPGVTDNPEISAVLSAIADATNTVVLDEWLAKEIVVDAALVAHEGAQGGIDSDSSNTVLGNLGLEIALAHPADLNPGLDVSNSLRSIEHASLFKWDIRVVLFLHELAILVGNDILVGIGHQTTIACIASADAVDKVRLRE